METRAESDDTFLALDNIDEPIPNSTPSEPLRRALGTVARRSFVLFGLGALAACTTQQKVSMRLPSPIWPDDVGGDAPDIAPPEVIATSSTRDGKLGPHVHPSSVCLFGAHPRSEWATESPSRTLMNKMLPVKHITVHHDGIPTLFTGSDAASTCARIEFVRRGHRNKGWGDIGYHFIIDRSGAVWEGRPIAWQGAHVRDHNEGNVGILVMGNFEIQKPTSQQLASLDELVSKAKSHWRVKSSNLRSHREWEDAATSCPGRNLQSKWKSIRATIA